MPTRTAAIALLLAAAASACSPETPAPPPPAANTTPRDAQHQGITTPHGDHSPHHGGLVLMNGELHYEVVFDREGRHRIWFTDAVRQDLPASIARDVTMTLTRAGEKPEVVAFEIDDAGESWIARGRPVTTADVMAKITYSVRGAPHEVEIPVLTPR